MLRSSSLLACSLLLWTTVSAADTAVRAPALAPATEPARGFFWVARGKAGTAYLLGSIHMADDSVYPLAPEIMQAFEESGALVVEADVTAVGALSMVGMMRDAAFKDGGSLRATVSKETWKEVAKAGEELGLPVERMNPFLPWMVAMTLQAVAAQRMGLDPEQGIDLFFLRKAHARKMPVLELEGAEGQMKLLGSLPMEQQEALLFQTAKDMHRFEPMLREIMAQFRGGDAAAFERLMRKEELAVPRLKKANEIYLHNRNTRMARKIELQVNPKRTLFVIVGAAHMTGPTGIVSRLRARGFSVEQVRR